MEMKIVLVVLAALAVVSADEKVKRQANGPDFAEYFNQFQEQLKPIAGNFPSLPNGFGSFPSFPGMEGSTGSLPSFPGMGGSSGSFPSFPGMGGSITSGSSPTKRQISQESMQEFFNKLQESANNFGSFKPGFPGFFPTPGSSSENNGNTGNGRH